MIRIAHLYPEELTLYGESGNIKALTYTLDKENIEYDKEEILDVKWFDYSEIMNKMDDKLRGSYVKKAVYNQNNNLIAPIEIVNILND